MKERHFGGADVRLHASAVRDFTPEQVQALTAFFREQPFFRFAVTMEKAVDMPADVIPMNVMPGALRRRWEELTARSNPVPTELAFIHEASERGDNLLERYFGEFVVQIDGRRVPAHHAIMTKGDEALEVADFIVHTAGKAGPPPRRRQARSQRLRSHFQDKPAVV